MISTACPACQAYYGALGRKDGGCRPHCPKNTFRLQPTFACEPPKLKLVPKEKES